MGNAVRILKIDTDKNPDISTQLQVGAAGATGAHVPRHLAAPLAAPPEPPPTPPRTRTPTISDTRPAHPHLCGHGRLQARAAHRGAAARAGEPVPRRGLSRAATAVCRAAAAVASLPRPRWSPPHPLAASTHALPPPLPHLPLQVIQEIVERDLAPGPEEAK